MEQLPAGPSEPSTECATGSAAVERRVNLIGMPSDDPEPAALLGRAGIVVNGSYSYRSSLADWRRIECASTSCVVESTSFPGLVGKLREYGQRVIEVSSPYGLEGCLSFYRRIGEALDGNQALDLERLAVLAGVGHTRASKQARARLA